MYQKSFLNDTWIPVQDGNASARSLFDRHYSRKNTAKKFVGPGEYLALMSSQGDALLVWRLEKYRVDMQEGVNCAVFRNEGAELSSALLLEGMAEAWNRWPGKRLFTFVDGSKVESSNPGYCFIKAGWKPCGYTAKGLRILECYPQEMDNAEVVDA